MLCKCRKAGFMVRGWARLIDSAVVDLAISMNATDLAYYSTGSGAQPNQSTTGDIGTRFLPDTAGT